MKIIFFGSDDFALYHLEKIKSSRHEILCCVTKEDKERDRHLQLKPTLIKEFALQHNIPLLQPEKIKDPYFADQLRSYHADLFVVIAYGKILPQEILDVPAIFSVNVHASLLPKYRGAAPINWAVINGETETGITIIKMSAQLDAGEMISSVKLPILKDQTSGDLRMRLMSSGGELLMKTLEQIEKKDFPLIAQDGRQVTSAPKISKELCQIDWKKSAKQIHDLVRGLLPRPAAFCLFEEKALKILESDLLEEGKVSAKPGEIVSIDKTGLSVMTGRGILIIKKVNLESSKSMDIHSFLRGHAIKVGDFLK